ncbi:hypothetical protein Droror1_Dr00008295 [Drosera rotundifolia]
MSHTESISKTPSHSHFCSPFSAIANSPPNTTMHTTTATLFPSSLILPFPRRPATAASRTFLAFPHRSTLRFFDSVRWHRKNGVRAQAMDDSSECGGGEDEEDDLVIEACMTRVLPSALSLQHGLEALRVELEELKREPPRCDSGLIRFEVAVPPCANALYSFCCQARSSAVFPQFYISNVSEESSLGSDSRDGFRAAFGIGSAVSINYPSSSYSSRWNTFRRFLLVDSLNITAYGFTNVSHDILSSIVKHEKGSFYFLIPQIELKEYDGFCSLSGTMAWCASTLCTFAEALHDYESSLFHARQYMSSPAGTFQNIIDSSLRALSIIEYEKMKVACLNTHLLASSEIVAGLVDMKYASTSYQFCLRLSSVISLGTNMFNLARETSFIAKSHANINALWASLIVEECCRLGLTYFCVAPGSRSSPLAVAASSHPHTTCIACFDERSLTFHAVGYARGSNVPAVVITTSGTAVSNLLPAVVEASQDFVPLLLLTADRPPELHETGANQAINQVNHFGSFVRFFFNLPAPTDHIPARMVLTTVGIAVNRATSPPLGPVHINCQFREPLDNSPEYWLPSCVDGLDSWISSTQPFTTYIPLHVSASVGISGSMLEIQELISSAKHGLLLIGAIHTDNEIWAALVLAQHLSWPVVADILSGVRIRKLWSSHHGFHERLIYVDHLDHILLSDAVNQWIKPDVVVQVGSKITSKRVSLMLEGCSPCSYIMVDQHPCRHDPSHVVTHRIQSTISQFADCILKVPLQRIGSKWSGFLDGLNAVVAREISSQIYSEKSLTEPHVAHELANVLSSYTALFLGNSMVIRDADMYSCGLVNLPATRSESTSPYQCIKVAGNRGASGIDGLLSTAIGFAVGCRKRVLCVLGDVSFLHDTNGLAILSLRMRRKPITIIVINNHGGAIFSFLPVAKRTDERILNEFFYYNHTISISNLCAAHGVLHFCTKTKAELQEALLLSQQSDSDCVIEVESSIDKNAAFHSFLRKHVGQVATQTFNFLSSPFITEVFQGNLSLGKIHGIKYLLYSAQLNAPPTSVSLNSSTISFCRQGFVLGISLEDGTVGYGEVAPLEANQEKMLAVEEQLRFILHALEGARISSCLPLLRGSFSSWIWTNIGVPPSSIMPSVRCGLEMAILNAFASRQSSSLLSVLHAPKDKVASCSHSGTRICALLDGEGAPVDVANAAYDLVHEGFCSLKLKVARRRDPVEDALVVQEIRKRVGPLVELRVDANRKWTYEQAMKFGSLVKGENLQYIEEPVQDEDDIIRFCEESSLPVALDETIDNIHGDVLVALGRFTHPGIVALVIKPSLVGGFENAAEIARWAHVQGKMAVVSAAFESSLSLSFYVQFAYYLDQQNVDITRALHKKLPAPVAHGLGTYRWLKEDVGTDMFKTSHNPCDGGVEASIYDADHLLRHFEINQRVILRSSSEAQGHTYVLNLETEDILYSVEVHEIGERCHDDTLLFLHGFLGTGRDWIPIMKALSGSARCISVNLPGHGKSKMQYHRVKGRAEENRISIRVIAAALCKLIDYVSPSKVTVVGYSMGGRIALYMALKFGAKLYGAIIISGSPGLKDATARKMRSAKDDARARSLASFGPKSFLESWYLGDLWSSFREHPSFEQTVERRLHQHQDYTSLAKALSDLSIGRQPSLWDELKHLKTSLLFIVGEKDTKFKKIMLDVCSNLREGVDPKEEMHEGIVVPDCGHAVHLENPLAVVSLARQFLTKLRKSNDLRQD